LRVKQDTDRRPGLSEKIRRLYNFWISWEYKFTRNVGRGFFP